MTRAISTPAKIFAGFSLWVLLAVPSVAAAQVGVVRIVNPNPFPVQLYSQRFDYFGNASWIPIAEVYPRSFLDLPNVPAGTMLGAENRAVNVFWPPFAVIYPRLGFPTFTYTLYPP